VAAVLASGPASAKPAARSAKTHKHRKAALRSVASDQPSVATDAKPIAIPASALLVQYQRVGRELLLLSNERRAQIGVEKEDAKLSCAELQAIFRSIKIDDAVKTLESRAAAAAVLQDLHGKIVRLRGVALSQECLDNPLAKECS
jgi:hypothetical protein